MVAWSGDRSGTIDPIKPGATGSSTLAATKKFPDTLLIVRVCTPVELHA